MIKIGDIWRDRRVVALVQSGNAHQRRYETVCVKCGRQWVVGEQAIKKGGCPRCGWDVLKNTARREARAAGKMRYASDRPCVKGHVAERFTINGSCIECCLARQRGMKRIRTPEERRRAMQNYLAKPEKREKHRAHIRNYRARKRAAEGKHTGKDVEQILVKQNWKCAYCRASVRGRRHVDHIVPIKRGGSNRPSNIQILCPKCNSRKSAKPPEIFAREIGLLL